METDNLSVHSTAKKKEKSGDQQQQRTIRFALELKESNDKYFPEFSFKELLRSALVGEEKDKLKELPVEDDGENEKLQALAKKFEEKYGPKQKHKKKRKERIQDLIDVTYGYDETDPFVDNSEAYDELIPSDWTTEHGGFYINQGGLNFKPISDDESDSEDFKGVKKRKTPKKLKDPNKVKKVREGGEKKRKHSTPDKEKKPRKIRLISGDKEKKHRKKLNSSSSTPNASSVLMKIISTTSSVASITQTASPGSVSSLTSSVTNNVTPAMSTEGSPQDKVNIKSETDDSLAKLMDRSENSLLSQDGISGSSAINQNGLPLDKDGGTTFVPQLPSGLPLSVEACVQKLKLAANNAADEGKCKFFNKDINQLLLEIETKSRELGCRIRSGIYDYLAFYLPCTKETLLKRAKKLLLTDQAGRLREPMAKLKAAIDKVMPDQIKAFEEEVRQHVEEQSKNTGVEEQSPEDKKKELFKSAMEVDDEGEKQDETTTPTNPSTPLAEEKTKKSLPRRKFIWTDELRELLSDVVSLRVKLFEMSKTRLTSAEEYLKEFFETEVKPLWPKGWMTSRILFKESKSVHTRVTSAQLKPKKVPGPKKQGESALLGESIDTSGQLSTVPKEDKNTSAIAAATTTNTTTTTPTTVTATVPSVISKVEQMVTSTTPLTASNLKTIPKLNAGALSMLKAKIIQVNNPGALGKTNLTTQIGNKPVSALILSAKTPTSNSVSSNSSLPLKSPTSIPTTKPTLTAIKTETTASTKPPVTMATTSTVSMVTSVPKPVDINTVSVESRGAVTKVESTVDKRPGNMGGLLVGGSSQQQQQQQQQQQFQHHQQQSQQKQQHHHQTQQHHHQQFQQHQQKQQWQQQQQHQQQQHQQQHHHQHHQQQQQPPPPQKHQNQHEQEHPQQKSPVNSLGQLSSTSQHFHQQAMQNTGMKSSYHQSAVTSSVKTPPTQPINPVIKSQPVTILDFADMMSTESSDDSQEMLNNQMPQPTRYADKSPSPQKPKEPSLPPKGSTNVMSPQRQQTNSVYTSPSNIMRSPSQMTQARNNMQQTNAALANMLLGMGSASMQNKFIDLNAATMMAQQRQQAANTKTILDSITSPSRMNMDIHSSSVPLSHPMISPQLTNPTPSVSSFIPNSLQQPTLSMLGHTNLPVKNTNPLSHLGMVADPVTSSLMHINRPLQQQQVQQSGMVMPPNPFNQGYNIPSTQANTPLQMSQSSLLSNQNIFQDPNHNPSGAHPPSPFMPRFS